MSALAAVGVYVPVGRLPRAIIGAAWGTPAGRGERSVAAGDEDALTMAVAAGEDALRAAPVPRSAVGAVFFATTTATYAEKLGAATIAAALDLPDDARTLDVTDSLRCGLSALRAAAEAVDAGAVAALVIASDCRVPAPNTPAEQTAGDAAVALLLTREGELATLDAWAQTHDDVTARWRQGSDRIVRQFEPRLETVAAYGASLPGACTRALEAAGVDPGELAHAALAGPDARSPAAAARAAGIGPEAVVTAPLDELGDAGAAAPGLALVRALERATAGDRMLAGGAGDGAEVVVLTRGRARLGEPLQAALGRRRELRSYEAYLSARRLLLDDDGAGDLAVSPVAYWRRRRAILGRYGGRCRSCETVQFPPAATCVSCAARDTLEPHRLQDSGTVYAHTTDHLIGGGYDQEGVARCVLELDGGGRFYTSMTDCDPRQVHIGMAVALTFRSRGGGGGFHNYGWKCRPLEG